MVCVHELVIMVSPCFNICMTEVSFIASKCSPQMLDQGPNSRIAGSINLLHYVCPTKTAPIDTLLPLACGLMLQYGKSYGQGLDGAHTTWEQVVTH